MGSPAWSADGRFAYTTLGTEGGIPVVRFDVETGEHLEFVDRTRGVGTRRGQHVAPGSAHGLAGVRGGLLQPPGLGVCDLMTFLGEGNAWRLIPDRFQLYPGGAHYLSRTGDLHQGLDRLLRIYEFLERHIRD